MKKLFIAVMLLGAMTMSAADYTHSVGVNVGGMDGFSYKGFIFGVDGLALQVDFGARLEKTAGLFKEKDKYDGHTTTSKYQAKNAPIYTFEMNPNVLYQKECCSFNGGSLSWFAGGGISLGLMGQMGTAKFKSVSSSSDGNENWEDWDYVAARKVGGYDNEGYEDYEGEGGSDKWGDVKKWMTNEKDKETIYGKFGVNAIVGLEMNFSNAPLALSFDFRPGYGLGFWSKKSNSTTYNNTFSFFDWSIAVGLRYCL